MHILITIFFIGIAATATASDFRAVKAKAPAEGNRIRVNSEVVLVPVTVTDTRNGFVTGLQRENFRVFESRQEQELVYFSTEETPISVGILFDASGSMSGKMISSRQAVASFLRTMNLEDETFLLTFNGQPAMALEFSRRHEQVQAHLMEVEAAGRTALFDSIYMGVHQLKDARHSRKTLLVFSDGDDNSSRFSGRALLDLVRESDVQIYAIGFAGQQENSFTTRMLTEVAKESGGKHFVVENAAQLNDVAERIGRELRNHYVLGYSPSNTARDGKYRPLRVQLQETEAMGRLRVHARQGYRAPTQ
jgi:Ca-activated chloride channel homolog